MAAFYEILNQYNQLLLLIGRMNEFMDRCYHHVVIEPEDKLEEAVRYGFPEDVARYYRLNYLELNRIEAETVINIMRDRCIPYLEGKLARLKEILERIQQ